MDRRRAAAALLALAACFACSTAAPTSDQTALDLYEEPAEGCYYNFQHYGEGDRIMTNEPCLNCTCHNKMLMCYLRVCPFTKAIGQDCTVEKRADQCCPIVTCPDVPVDLLTSTSTSSPAEYGGTGLGKVDNYGCTINGKYFPEGAKVPPTPNKPCEHCYCIRNMTTCVMQECTLHVDGCTPIYHKDVCCPVRYFCDHPEDEIPLLDDMTTTVRPTPGFLLTTTTEIVPTTEVEVKRQCVENDQIHEDGALIKKENPCEHCYCMKGDIVCVVQECGTPMENEGKNCTSVPPREGQCCPDTYICEGDELPSEFVTKSPFEDITTTLQPPRRVAEEGSGYRKDETPFTEIPTFASEAEGSGEEAETSKPTEAFMPDSQTTPEFATTEEGIQHVPLTTMGPVFEDEVKETTEPDRGLNTIEEEVTESPESKPTTPVIQSDITVPALPHEAVTSEESQEPSLSEKTTTQEGIIPTEMPEIPEKPTTVIDVEDMSEPSIQDLNTSKDEFIPVTTEPAQIHELTTLTTSVDVQDSESTLPPKETTAYSDLIEEETKKTVSDDAVTTVSDATTEIYDENKLPTISTSDTTDVTFKDKEEDEEGSGLDKTTTEPEGSGHNTIPEDITEYSVLKTTSSVLQELTTEPSKYTSADEMRTTIQPVASEEMQTTLATDDMITKTETFTTIDDSRGSETDKADEDKATTQPQEKTTLPPSDDETADQEITVTKQVVDSATTEPQEMTTTPERQDLGATKPGEQEVTSVTEADIVSTTSEVEKQEVPDVNNPDENEIAPPGRIPGEGDCLLNGITYQNESSVPSTNKCYSNCRCLSSIVKCDPIICSPQPEYMNNCQPVYDTPESCCPTYVCDHSQETVPPQSHSQMSGTDSPLPSPSVECEGDECKPIEDKQPVPTSPTECTSDSCQSEVEPKPDGVSCGPDGCDEIVQKPVDACPNGLCELPPTKEQVPPSPSAEEGPLCDNPEDCKRIKEPEQEVSPSCKGDSCIVPKPQECNKEGGCDKPQPKPCEGEHCEIQPESGTSKPQEDCNEEDGCKETKLPEICDKEGGCDTPHEPCQGENCKVLPETGTGKPQQDCNTDEGCKEGTVPEICNEEGGCDKPQQEQCEGENCNVLPETGTGKPQEDCNNEDGCKDATLPQTVIPPCEGESCPGIKEQSCDTETGCKNVESQPCEGNNCEKQPVAPHCAGEDCQKTETTGTIAPDCEGDSCVNVNVPVQPIETSCEGKQCDVETNLGTEKPSDECTGPECLQQPETVDKTTDNVQDITETTIKPAGEQDTKHTLSPTTESTYLHPQSTEDISTDVDKEHPHESSETSEPGDKITSIPQDITTEPIEFAEDKQTESPSPIVTELPEMQVTDFRRKEESLSTEIEENPTDKPTISETTAKMETITPSVEHEITTPTSLVTEPQEIPQKEKPEDEDTLTTIEQDESVTEPSSSGILKEQTDKSTDIPQIADKDALTTVTSLTQDEQVTEYPTPGTSEEETVKTTEVPHISEKETEHPDSTKKDMEESTTLGLEINTIDTEPAIEGETKTSEMSTKELPEGVTKPYPIDELKTTLSEFITESAVSAEVTTTKPLPADEEVPQEGTTSNIPLASEDVIETQTSITEGLLSTEKTEIVTDAPKEEAEDEVVSTSTIDNDSLSGGSITTTKIPEQTKQKPEEVSTYKPVDEDYVTPSQEVTKQPEEETTDNQTSKLDLVTELPELPTTIKELYETITPESDVTDKEKVHTEAPLSLETIKQDIDDTLKIATSPKPEDISTDSLPIFTKESEPTIEDEFKVKTEKPEITEPQSLDDRNELSTKPTEKEKDVTESPQTEVKTEIPVEVTEADEAITVKEQITTESSESPVTSAAEFTPTAESSTKIPEKVETEKPIITSEIGTSTEAVTQEQDTEPPTQHLDTIPPKDSQEDIKTESPVTISTEINTEAEPGIHPEVTKQSSATEPSHKDDSTTEVDELLTTKTLPVTETTESNIPSQEKDVTEIPSLYDQKTNEPEIMTDEQKTDEPEVHDDDKKTEKPLITEDKTQDKTESPEIVTEEQIHLTEPPTSQADYSTVEGDHITQKPDFTKEEITTTEVSLPKVTSFVDDDSSKVAETNEPEISATQPTYDEKQTEGPNVQPETKPSDDTDQTEPEIKTEEPLVFPTKETTPHELEEMPVKDVTATTSEPIEPIEMDEINTEAPKEGDTQVPTDSPILVDTKETEESSEQPFITVTDQQEEEVITDHTRRKEPTPTIPPEKPEVIENDENLTKSPEEQELPTSSSPDYSETTPYLVELEEHPHVEGQTTPGPLEDMSATPPFEEKEQTPEISSDSIQTTAKPFMETEKPVDATLSGEEETISPTDVPVSVQGSEPSIPVHIDEQTDNKYGTDQPKEQEIASTEGLHTIPDEEKQTTSVPIIDTEKPVSQDTEEESKPDKDLEPSTLKPASPQFETTTPEEFITAKVTTAKTEEEVTTQSVPLDKFTKPDEKPTEPLYTAAPETQKPGLNELQPTDEVPPSEDDGQFPPSGGYGQEPDYGDEDQAFGPGTCRYGGKVYVSAQQIPRDDPCDFCFCFRSDIICLQQSCPPPIHGCHEEPIQGFCCPRYECPVSMATAVNVTTTSTTTTTTLPPHFLPHAYKGAAQRRGCLIKGHTYKVGELVRASSGPCLHCTCGGDGQMKCDPKVCTPEPMLRQMIAAAVSAKRRR